MLKKVFACLVICIFLIFALPFVIVSNAYWNLTDQQFYEGEVLDFSYDLLIEELPKRIDLEQFSALTEDDFRKLIEKVFQKEDLLFIFSDVIAQIKDLQDVDDELKIRIPLSQLNEKDEVLAQELTDLLYKKLPKCSDSQMEKIQKLECIPESIPKIDFQTRMKAELDRNFFANLPQDYFFKLNVPKQFQGNFVERLNRIVKLVFTVGLVWLLILLTILALIIRTSWKKVVMWQAASIFLVVVFYMILGTIFKATGGIQGIVSHTANDTDYNLNIVLGFLDVFLDRALTSNWIFIIGVVSFFLWIAFGIWSSEKNKPRNL